MASGALAKAAGTKLGFPGIDDGFAMLVFI